MAVRTNYIKSLMESKKSLDKQYEDVIKESIKNIIGDKAKEEVRNLLKEAEEEDTYETEDVNVETGEPTKEEETQPEENEGGEEGNGEKDEHNEEDVNLDSDPETVPNNEGGETEDVNNENELDNDIWNDLEDFKTDDNEYDLRGMDSEQLVKVLKSMGPEDGIVVDNVGDNQLQINVDPSKLDGETEFIIELDDPTEDSTIKEGKNDIGYTDEYQKVSAIDIDNNDEVADKNSTVPVDAGLPKGVERPYGGVKKAMFPYEIEITEDECHNGENVENGEEVNEVATTTENNPAARGTSMTHANTNQNGKQFRNSSEGGVKVKGTSQNSYSETNESIEFKRKVNALYEENKQLKKLIPQLQEKIEESIVINKSLGLVVRLLNENTTTTDEKREITERFTKVKTLNESQNLYETISTELSKNGNRITNFNTLITSNLSEGRQTPKSLIENTIYQSDEINETINFMDRLEKIK